MRGPRTLVEQDRETGLALYAEQRREPGGGTAYIYVFKVTPPRGLPEHLAPSDAGDRHAALRAFPVIVAWLKANPT